MREGTKRIVRYLESKKIIGKKHTPEKKLLKRMFLNIPQKNERNNILKEYNALITIGYIMKTRKKTGKGSDWHISLNPRKIKEINRLLEE